MKTKIRKIVTFVEETRIEGGRDLVESTRRAAAVAVIANPYTGEYVEDLALLSEMGEELGELLTTRAVEALAIPGDRVESFGKAAVVGADGELEHAAAILHPRLGAPVRRILGRGPALIPSSKKRAGMGAPIDIPLGHKDAAKVRSHFDGMEVRVADAPRDNEIVVAVSVTDSGRPHPRVGGLTKDQIKGENGVD
ncbi:amino acid synthesis family protein [Brucella oryzae]|uniref:amino acid synthesis family protein n=1 Tax=Brucella oryzae TaxID=335286 RepID=UPI001B81513E|nr:amino acid synthesis family protein [Brucella oryzae]MBR7654717.1 amino acid synthesis family protein [Brucella oryzae]